MKYNRFPMILIRNLIRGKTKLISSSNRVIISRQKDKKVRANILFKKKKIKTDIALEYHWYKSKTLGNNYGDYTGYLLHGNYEVFDLKNRMLTKGYFNYGVKNNTWKYWYENGKIKLTEKWIDGRLSGQSVYYSSTGEIERIENYVNGIFKETKISRKETIKDFELVE